MEERAAPPPVVAACLKESRLWGLAKAGVLGCVVQEPVCSALVCSACMASQRTRAALWTAS